MAEVTDEVPISHLQRRKIESRVLIPFIAACREKFGDAATQRTRRSPRSGGSP